MSCIQAEKALIGSVLIDSTILDRIGFRVEERDFESPTHRLIWKSIDSMYKNNKPIDIVTITEAFNKYDRLRDLGGFDYLNDIVSETITSKNYKYYAEILRENAITRRVANAAMIIQKIADEHEFSNVEELYNQLEAIVDSVRDQHQIESHLIKDLRDKYEEYLFTKRNFIYTGFPQFDSWSGGLDPGWLYVLAARPGIGKTAKMLQMAYNIAKREDHGPVAIFSLEMKREELINRLVSSMTSITLKRFKYKDEFNQGDLLKIEESLDRLSEIPIQIIDKEGMSIEEIRSVSRQVRRQYGKMGAIFIDYLGIMAMPENRSMTYAQKIGEVTKRSKWLANEMNCPLILLTQMSREGEKATKPSLMHLRDSGSIEQDADVVELLWEDPEDTNTGYIYDAKVIQSSIAKGRNIGVRDFRYAFKSEVQVFKDLPPKISKD